MTNEPDPPMPMDKHGPLLKTQVSSSSNVAERHFLLFKHATWQSPSTAVTVSISGSEQPPGINSTPPEMKLV